MSGIKEESFIGDISVAPTAVIFAENIKKPLTRYSLKFILNRTRFFMLSSYDKDGKATRPGLLFNAHHFQPQDSILLNYEPSCNISLAILRSYLKCFLHLSTFHQDAVIEKLLHETRINDGYNNLRPTRNHRNNSIFNRAINNDEEDEEEMRPEFMNLAVTINQVIVEHVCVPPVLRKSAQTPETEDCSVCLEELNGNKQPLTSLCCDHVFHEACIVNWLASRITSATTTLSCPLCRSRVHVDKISSNN